MDISIWIILGGFAAVLLIALVLWKPKWLTSLVNKPKDDTAKEHKAKDDKPKNEAAKAPKVGAKPKSTADSIAAPLQQEGKDDLRAMVLQAVKEQMASYKNCIVDLQNRIAQLGSTVEQQQREMNELRRNVEQLQRELAALAQSTAATATTAPVTSEASPAPSVGAASEREVELTQYFPAPNGSKFYLEDGEASPSDKSKFSITFQGEKGLFTFISGILDALKNGYIDFSGIVEAEGCSWEQAKNYEVLEKGKVVKDGATWKMTKRLKVRLS